MCFLVAVVCLQAFLPANTPLLGVGSADPGFTCTIMIVAGAALAAWGYTLRQRCPDHFIGRRLVAVVGLLAFWLSIVIVKYPSHYDPFIIACWYAYYIPMLAIPTLLFSCALRAATFESTKLGKIARTVAIVISSCLTLFVLTNNSHMCVFSFTIGNRGWDGQYTYGIGYWCVVVWLVALYVSSFALLFVAARKNLRPAFLPIVVVGGIAIVYCILYALRVEFFFHSNFSLTCVILLVVAIETIMDTGIFPSAFHYAEIFDSLPFHMKLVSEIETNTTNPYRTPDPCTNMPFAEDENTLVRKFPIKGGEAVTFIDVSDINERKKILEERNKKLADANSILENMLNSKRELTSAKSEEDLLKRIDSSLEEKVCEINSILENLPVATDDESRKKRRNMLMRVRFLTAYCKRKASLVISETEHVMFDQAQVSLIFTESASDFRSIGIVCAVLVQNLSPVSPATMEKIYDAVYDEIESALSDNCEFAIVSMSDTSACAIEIRFSFSEENVKTLTISKVE